MEIETIFLGKFIHQIIVNYDFDLSKNNAIIIVGIVKLFIYY